jgi:hypothetical protein
VYTSAADPLYKALDAFEDAASAVGVQTITAQGAYRQLTDAISGNGDLEEARSRFTLEATVLTVQHGTWSEAARLLMIEVAEAAQWQARFTPKGNPFEEVAAQPYGEGGFVPGRLIDAAMADVAKGTTGSGDDVV